LTFFQSICAPDPTGQACRSQSIEELAWRRLMITTDDIVGIRRINIVYEIAIVNPLSRYAIPKTIQYFTRFLKTPRLLINN
jgi:hypothetical protein